MVWTGITSDITSPSSQAPSSVATAIVIGNGASYAFDWLGTRSAGESCEGASFRQPFHQHESYLSRRIGQISPSDQ